ncbi:uncharacterized protein si:ch211-266k8.4, partial [Tachysurus ichikawai]
MMLRRRSSSSSSKVSARRRSSRVGFDEFGFAFSRRKERKLQHRSHDYSYPQLNTVKVKELCELLSYWNGSSFICKNQIERYIRIGIPPALRGRVWKCLLDIETVRGASGFSYKVDFSQCYPQLNTVKVKELCELLSYWNGSSFICKNQIERYIRIGIPPALRGRVWKCLLDIETVRGASGFSYKVCLSEIRKPLVDLGVSEYSIISAISILGERENQLGSAAAGSLGVDVPLFRQIALDLQRSFPTHRSLMGDTPEAIEGQAKLFRVLTAYARYNPQIGYSQGMSYIAAVLLMLLAEEEAFWALVVLLEKPKYLSELFDSSLKKIQHHALVFQQLLKHRKPQVFQHLEKLGVSSVHFIMQWFLTLFTSLPCWDSVLAIWDLFLLH